MRWIEAEPENDWWFYFVGIFDDVKNPRLFQANLFLHTLRCFIANHSRSYHQIIQWLHVLERDWVCGYLPPVFLWYVPNDSSLDRFGDHVFDCANMQILKSKQFLNVESFEFLLFLVRSDRFLVPPIITNYLFIPLDELRKRGEKIGGNRMEVRSSILCFNNTNHSQPPSIVVCYWFSTFIICSW